MSAAALAQPLGFALNHIEQSFSKLFGLAPRDQPRGGGSSFFVLFCAPTNRIFSLGSPGRHLVWRRDGHMLKAACAAADEALDDVALVGAYDEELS